MKLGTRSVLYGYHCVAIHWVFVALGWFSLYRFRAVPIGTRKVLGDLGVVVTRTVTASLWDPRVWIAFVVHDLGYWGKPNMDGPEGETHPELGAGLMRHWFGEPWGAFSLYHSRFYAKRDGAKPSMLCYPDKVAFLRYPTWLIVFLTGITGEYEEYKTNYARDNPGMAPFANATEWADGVKAYVTTWVATHKDGADDTATIIREH